MTAEKKDQRYEALLRDFLGSYLASEDALLDLKEISASYSQMPIDTVQRIVIFRASWEFDELYDLLILREKPIFAMTWTI